MTSPFLTRAAITATLICMVSPSFAGPLDRDTPACAIAREAPTDANIEACTGEPVDLSGSGATHEDERG